MRVLTLGATLTVTFLALPGPPARAQDAAPEERRPMTVDDVLDMVSVGSPIISPDGSWVLYSRRRLDWEENEYETEYWRVSTDGGEAFQYIGDDGGSGFSFSPDGRYLAFRRSVDDEQQIWLMRTGGGEATQLTDHETSVRSFEWADDGSAIFFSAEDQKPEEVEKAEDKGGDVVFVDEGPNGQTASYWSNLWIYDLEEEEERKITEEEFILGGFDPSPDGTRVALTARYRNRRNDSYLNEIYLADVETGELTRLTENEAPEGGLAWAPNGETILFTAADDEDWVNRNTKLWLLDPETGEHRLLSDSFQGSPRGPVWTNNSRQILFTGQQGTDTNLYAINASTGEVTQLTDVEGSLNVSSYSADRSRYAYTFSDYRTPTDIWVGGFGRDEGVRLTEANPQVDEWKLAEMEVISWQSTDGFTIEGLVHLPPDHEAGERLPLVLNIHGGPAGSFRNSWRASYHVYAGLGYASLSPNVRGSSGYTDHLREGNTVQKGDGIGFGDYRDLMTGVDKVIADGLADPDRLALKGWSYGGILGGWTITRTDRFKAASIGAGVYDWTSEYGPGFNNDVRLWHIGGTPWENPEAWRNQSALTHVANVTTPTLLLHGERDTTDTEQQSMMFFTALKDIGEAPVRYIKFPREPHGFREPRHQRIRDIEEIRWMQKHVLGIEWTPWERPDGEEKESTGTGDGG